MSIESENHEKLIREDNTDETGKVQWGRMYTFADLEKERDWDDGFGPNNPKAAARESGSNKTKFHNIKLRTIEHQLKMRGLLELSEREKISKKISKLYPNAKLGSKIEHNGRKYQLEDISGTIFVAEGETRDQLYLWREIPEDEIVNADLDALYPNAESRTVVRYKDKDYEIVYYPLKKSISGKTVYAWSHEWRPKRVVPKPRRQKFDETKEKYKNYLEYLRDDKNILDQEPFRDIITSVLPLLERKKIDMNVEREVFFEGPRINSWEELDRCGRNKTLMALLFNTAIKRPDIVGSIQDLPEEEVRKLFLSQKRFGSYGEASVKYGELKTGIPKEYKYHILESYKCEEIYIDLLLVARKYTGWDDYLAEYQSFIRGDGERRKGKKPVRVPTFFAWQEQRDKDYN